MNLNEKYALAAARLLREQISPSEPAENPTHRDRLVAAMELALAEQTRRRRIVRAGYWTLAAAAGVLLMLKLTHGGQAPVVVEQMHGQGNLLLRQGEKLALSTSTSLSEGDEVRSGETGGATLGLGRGTKLDLASASQVKVIDVGDTRQFLLLHGRLDASVAKLRTHERLLVTTPDGEVEVRGTRFSVRVTEAPAGCGGADWQTSVEVQDGTVWVRCLGEERVLTAGQSFTRPCAVADSVQAQPVLEPAAPVLEEQTIEPAAPVREERTSSASPRRKVSIAAPARTPAEAPEPESQLAEQNDLLSSAMVAARAGQHKLALRRLDDLLARFPEGPLSETARIEIQRIKAAQKSNSE